MNYRNLKPNQMIRFYVPNGLKWDRKTGMLVQEYKAVRSRVNPLLIFHDHVVVNHGPCGTVVDDSNFIQAY